MPGLSLDNAHLSPISLDALATLQHLTRLGLPHTHGLTTRSLRLLAPLRQLTYLDLSDSGVSGGLEHLDPDGRLPRRWRATGTSCRQSA